MTERYCTKTIRVTLPGKPPFIAENLVGLSVAAAHYPDATALEVVDARAIATEDQALRRVAEAARALHPLAAPAGAAGRMRPVLLVLASSAGTAWLIIGAAIVYNGGPLDDFSVSAGLWAGLGGSLAHSFMHRRLYR
jgi:hypothetical protein